MFEQRPFATASLFLLATFACSNQAQEVAFENEGTKLKGSLHLPAGDQACPVVVVCHGSGPESRNDPLYKLNVEELVPAGVGVFLYDKRGCGESEGVYEEWPPLTLLAGDAVAAVKAAKSAGGSRVSTIGLRGLSQGGIIAPLAASLSSEIKFVIAESGPAVQIFENAAYQDAERLMFSGVAPAAARRAFSLRRDLLAYYASGQGYTQIDERWEAARREEWFKEAGLRQAPVAKPEVVASPQYESFRRMGFQISDHLSRVRVPILITFGSDDRHLDVSRNVAKWQEGIEQAGLSDATLRVFYGAGHGLNVLPEGGEQLATGAHAMPTIRRLPGYAEFVLNWIKQVTN